MKAATFMCFSGFTYMFKAAIALIIWIKSNVDLFHYSTTFVSPFNHPTAVLMYLLYLPLNCNKHVLTIQYVWHCEQAHQMLAVVITAATSQIQGSKTKMASTLMILIMMSLLKRWVTAHHRRTVTHFRLIESYKPSSSSSWSHSQVSINQRTTGSPSSVPARILRRVATLFTAWTPWLPTLLLLQLPPPTRPPSQILQVGFSQPPQSPVSLMTPQLLPHWPPTGKTYPSISPRFLLIYFEETSLQE